MIDEFDETFTIEEFTKRAGLNMHSVFGATFPESATLTNNFKLKTGIGTALKCVCLCKTFDFIIWRGCHYLLSKNFTKSCIYIQIDLKTIFETELYYFLYFLNYSLFSNMYCQKTNQTQEKHSIDFKRIWNWYNVNKTILLWLIYSLQWSICVKSFCWEFIHACVHLRLWQIVKENPELLQLLYLHHKIYSTRVFEQIIVHPKSA